MADGIGMEADRIMPVDASTTAAWCDSIAVWCREVQVAIGP